MWIIHVLTLPLMLPFFVLGYLVGCIVRPFMRGFHTD